MEKSLNEYLNTGASFYLKGEFKEASKVYSDGLLVFPQDPGLINNLAACFNELEEYEKAATNYEIALEINPKSAIFTNNLAVSQKHLGKTNLAIKNLKKASDLDPELEDPFYNLGNIYREKADYKKAISYYKKSISKNSTNPKVWNNLGITFREINDLPKAKVAYLKSLEVDPKYHEAYTGLMATLQELCLWEELSELREKIRKLDVLKANKKVKTITDPFFSVTYEQKPKDNLFYSQSWSSAISSRVEKSLKLSSKSHPRQIAQGDKLRLGFVSDGFRNFATGHNIVSLLENLSKLISVGFADKKFEVYAYSHGDNDKSEWRKRIEKTTNFRDISKLTDEEAARLIHSDKIDILFDLKGFTKNSRLQIFAHRPSHIQIAYLGFPGSTGADFIDYIIADRIVIPESEQVFFSEKVLYMPDCYRPLDGQATTYRPLDGQATYRPLDGQATTYRPLDGQATYRPLDSPEKQFTFSSFNNLYKIEPVVWGTWVEILINVPNSKLHLWNSNPHAKKQILEYAKRDGVVSQITFGETLAKHEHLLRLSSCDLALDTFTTNGHTTTVDNLIAGTPVITLKGNHFNSRVSASVLSSLNLNGLIVNNPIEYKTLAISLAKSPKKLRALRKKLTANRKKSSLFDMDKYTLDFEKLIAKANKNAR